MYEKINAVREQLYQYNDRDMLVDGKLALFLGDLLWKDTSDPEETRLYTPRGMIMRYPPHQFMRHEEDETFSKRVRADTTDDEVVELIDLARRQESYQDAHEYWASRDGSFAVAVWFRYRSIYRLERMDDHFTWTHCWRFDRPTDLIECDHVAFNPKNLRIVPESEMARRTRMKGRSMLGQIGDAVLTRAKWSDLKDIPQLSVPDAMQKAVTEACQNG